MKYSALVEIVFKEDGSAHYRGEGSEMMFLNYEEPIDGERFALGYHCDGFVEAQWFYVEVEY